MICHTCIYIICCQSFVAVPIRKKRCGQCHGCTLPDCAKCSYCKDMRKFGGPGRKKKGCIQRKCTFYENEKVSNNNTAQKTRLLSLFHSIHYIHLLNNHFHNSHLLKTHLLNRHHHTALLFHNYLHLNLNIPSFRL